MSPKKVGIIANVLKPGAAELLAAITKEFARHNISTELENETAGLTGKTSGASIADVAEAALTSAASG